MIRPLGVCALFCVWCTTLVLPTFSQNVTVSPTSISFGSKPEGMSTPAYKVTLENGQDTAITISSISANLLDYSESSSCPLSPATLAAGHSCTIEVTFTPTALGERDGTLSVVDSGTSSPQTVALSGTGTSPDLLSINVTPSMSSLPLGTTGQLTAMGTYSNQTTQNVTTKVNWTSSEPSVAVLSGKGLAEGVGMGSATIEATTGTVNGSATLTVTAAILSSIAVTPTATSVTAGNSLQFTATGTYSNGSTQNLTSTVTWASSQKKIAKIGAGGLATTSAQGTTEIQASSGEVSGSAVLNVTDTTGQISSFKHVIVIVQENRTPDNLFQGLCSAPYGTSNSCSSTPTGSQYDIQTANWLDETSSTGTTQPVTVPLANKYDLNHSHFSFVSMCDVSVTGICQMDGAAHVICMGTCPTKPQFAYVDNSTGILNPYLTLAIQYGWSNYMFQTNQGPSFPAHQFLFGATSAPSAADDAAGIFVFANPQPNTNSAGCIAPEGSLVSLIGPLGDVQTIYPPIYPCFEHQTMADLLDSAGVGWKYYTLDATYIWTAPSAIQHICVPSGGICTGPDWENDVVIGPAKVLTDISSCALRQVSWVIPTGQNSDHADINTGGGPSWVASIVNAVGTQAQCPNGDVYWNDTAIFITWDDWGGWYDHEPPTFLAYPQGDYQIGFRVPLVVVSAYTPAGFVDNNRLDFGSILRFLQYNFGIEEGSLNFADARSQDDLTEFFNLTEAPRAFQTIPAQLDKEHFLNDKETPSDPDDD